MMIISARTTTKYSATCVCFSYFEDTFTWKVSVVKFLQKMSTKMVFYGSLSSYLAPKKLCLCDRQHQRRHLQYDVCILSCRLIFLMTLHKEVHGMTDFISVARNRYSNIFPYRCTWDVNTTFNWSWRDNIELQLQKRIHTQTYLTIFYVTLKSRCNTLFSDSFSALQCNNHIDFLNLRSY